ncbi:MAG TPA: RHS repeat-associated core domain-containing protein [Trebonia sp.]|nr:RHS repeat-associated core domain-containing protein [Trebonia sp.]
MTTEQYDALGRATAVWLDSRVTSAPANYTYAYHVSDSGITAVTTQKLNDGAGYQTSTQIYDAMLRPRQPQVNTPTPVGGRLVTDTFYDSRGLTEATFTNWWDANNTPSTALATTDNGSTNLAGQAQDEDYYTYDGLGRQVIDRSEQGGAVVSTTTTVCNGDRTTVVPPVGGAVQTTLTDPLGRTSGLAGYSARPTVSVPANPSTGIFTISGGTSDTTTYGYDGHGNQATITAAGRTWTSTYNLAGQVTNSIDPDAGASSMSYDANGNLIQSTDSRGKTVSYTYDALNRKTGEYDSAATAQLPANELAAWVYDNSNAVAGVTDPVGQLTTETAYWGGAAYTVQQKAFNVFGESTGETVTIPSATEGTVLGKSYAFTHTYTTLTGLPQKDNYPAAGGLPAESALHGYAGIMNTPTTLGGLVGYAEGTTYDAWGHVATEQIGNTSGLADITNTYDPHTGNLQNSVVSRKTATPSTVDSESYTYDLAGNTTSQVSQRLGATASTETQCYSYDALARLAAAWTATDNCATTPTAGSSSMVGDPLGSSSAYWTSWGFDALGDRTSQVAHATASGGTDTTTGYAYNGNGKGQPDTLTSTAASGGSTAATSYGYDSDGNMTSRSAGQGSQALSWDDAGRLTAITGSTSGNSSYVYDADGGVLLQKDPGATTLYLPGEQITLNTATQATTGIRYFSLPGGGTAYRTGAGNSYGYEIADQQGTSLLTLDYTAQVPAWRQQAPYGAPRGTTASWVDNRAFLDKPADPATGLDIVGAREYDPVTGRFTSLDPVLEKTSPQQLNGYSYAAGNPVSTSDPTGLMLPGGYSGGPPCTSDCNDPAPAPVDTNMGGGTGTANTGDGGSGANRRNSINILAGFGNQVAGLFDSAVCQGTWSVCSPGTINHKYQSWIGGFPSVDTSSIPYMEGNALAILAAGAGDPEADFADADSITEWITSLLRRASDTCASGESFTPGTQVLLADGKTASIASLKPGDKVLATSTQTGKTSPESVAAVEVNHDTDLYNLRVKTPHGTQVIHTTSNHLFWDPYLHYGWIPAKHLKPGMHLKTPDGQSAVVVGGSVPAVHDGWMWDLTVQDDHDFYVEPAVALPPSRAGPAAVAVLVHNCTIPARSVRFTQDSAGKSFKDGRSVMDLAAGLSDGSVDPSSLPPIRIFNDEQGVLRSLDNRRLFAGQYADVELPYQSATPSEIASRSMTYVQNGDGITIRGIGWFNFLGGE